MNFAMLAQIFPAENAAELGSILPIAGAVKVNIPLNFFCYNLTCSTQALKYML